MQNIKSKVPYPCNECPRDGKQSCMDKKCTRWLKWFRSGVWKEATKSAKLYLTRISND